MKKAVVLLSGGLDSATCLYWAKRQGYLCLALGFDYGQRHKRESLSAMRLARAVGAPYRLIRFTLPWGGSSLLDAGSSLPKKRSAKEISGSIPSTYVPARNTIFLSFALSFADSVGASAIVIGANALDYSGYPDCRPDYLNAMQRVAKLGTKSGTEGKSIKILSPLVRMKKSEIVRLGMKLEVPYRWTWSCYQGGKTPCGQCDSCILRAKGFEEAGLDDPAMKRR